MRVMLDFQCSRCHEVHERFIDINTHVVECPCGGKAHKMMTAPTVKLEGITGDFPGAHNKWANIREDNYRRKQKRL